jgi:hypothetical protein
MASNGNGNGNGDGHRDLAKSVSDVWVDAAKDARTKIRPELMKALLRELEERATLIDACRIVGVHYGNLRYLLKRFHADEAMHPDLHKFCAQIERIRATHRKQAVNAVCSGQRGWQGMAWFLERTAPNQFALPAPIRLDIGDLRNLSDDDIDRKLDEFGRGRR